MKDAAPKAYRLFRAQEAHAHTLDASDPWQLVDVRTVEEFEAGHPAGAWNIPFAFRSWHGMQINPDFVAAVAAIFQPEDRLIMTCATGNRSQHACEHLAGAGFRHLANLHGGFNGARDLLGRAVEPGWQACSLPIETRPREGRSWEAVRRRADAGETH